MNSADTIVAVSSAVGQAARMIVRLSGPDSFQIVSGIGGPLMSAGAHQAKLRFADLLIPATLLIFRAPRSATGQDLVELHIPGNPLLARMLLKELIARGARQAEAGEFTARAYFNGKVDLTQAEGIAATISAANESELRAARQLLSGELARRLREPIDLLADSLALLEVGIDFSEEDVSFLPTQELKSRLSRIETSLNALVHESRRFERLTHEPTIALVGWPNAGKSTLLNALCGRQRAVVSPVAGTTRDIIWAETALRRGLVKIVDCAGIESSSGNATTAIDHIHAEMLTKARQAAETADVLVLVQEINDMRPPPSAIGEADLIARTKRDTVTKVEGEAPAEPSAESRNVTNGSGGASPFTLEVSAHTGQGMTKLRENLDQLAFGRSGGAALALNQRHLQLIADARNALAGAASAIEMNAGAELIALDLREALDHLGSIVGQITPDDVLGRVFGAFCIGK